MVLGHELFRDYGITDPGTDLAAHELGEILVGFRAGHDVVEIAQPFCEAGLRP